MPTVGDGIDGEGWAFRISVYILVMEKGMGRGREERVGFGRGKEEWGG